MPAPAAAKVVQVHTMHAAVSTDSTLTINISLKTSWLLPPASVTVTSATSGTCVCRAPKQAEHSWVSL
jgi:hypothetical protein